MGQLQTADDAYRQAIDFYASLAIAAAACEPHAELAALRMVQSDYERAHTYVETILATLGGGPCTVLNEPIYIYLVCYRLLEAVGEPRAEVILAGAQQLLRDHAATVTGEAPRRIFLEDVAVHHELRAARRLSVPPGRLITIAGNVILP